MRAFDQGFVTAEEASAAIVASIRDERATSAIGSELRKTASGCSHTARSDVQSNADDQEPTTGSSHG